MLYYLELSRKISFLNCLSAQHFHSVLNKTTIEACWHFWWIDLDAFPDIGQQSSPEDLIVSWHHWDSHYFAFLVLKTVDCLHEITILQLEVPLLCHIYRTQYIDTAFFAGLTNEISGFQTQQLLGLFGLVEANRNYPSWFLSDGCSIDKSLSCLSGFSYFCEMVKMRHS